MNSRRTSILIAVLIALICYAQCGPYVYWWYFPKSTPYACGGVTWCANVVAPYALRASGITSYPTVSDSYTAWGANSDTTVLVRCTPISSTSVSVTVTASSPYSSSASYWSNRVKNYIQSVSC
jgi:hypothetical protein